MIFIFLFACTTVCFCVYLLIARHKIMQARNEWRDAVASISKAEMINANGVFVPDPVKAVEIIHKTQEKYNAYIAIEDKCGSNIVCAAIAVLAVGVVASVGIVLL